MYVSEYEMSGQACSSCSVWDAIFFLMLEYKVGKGMYYNFIWKNSQKLKVSYK